MILNTLQLKRAVNVVLFFLLLSAVGMTKAFAQSFTVTDNRDLVANLASSTNILSIGNYTGAEGEILTIDINLANEDEVSGFQFDIPINEGFTYVNGSIVKSSRCSPNHIIIAQVISSGDLRVLCYTLQDTNISGNDGAIASLQILLGEEGTYDLSLENIVLSTRNGGVLPVISTGGTLTISGSHEYVDLGLPSGLLWATCNVGANAPEEYGDYFAWGETQPKDVYNWATYQYYDGSNVTKYTGSDGLTILLPEDDAATDNWGDGWRMPTKEEWQELLNNTTVTWTQQNGVNGRLFTAPNGNSLFLPAAGYRWDDVLGSVGSLGIYWSSSLNTGSPYYAWLFYFFSDYYDMYDYGRYGGLSVRAVRSASPVLSYIITATANPTEGGTIEGAGSYAEGSTCTLTATANEGYTFINWTENGEVVSTDATYSFVVTVNRNLVANFTATPTNILSIGDYTGAEGEILTVDINLANVDEVAGFLFDIPINEGFTYVEGSIAKGERCGPNFILISQIVSSGALRVLCYSMPGTNISGNDGTIASLQILLGEAGTYDLGLTSCVLSTMSGGILPVIGNGGTLTVTGGQTVTYTVTATVNPAEGGTVTGSGTYQEGQTCTLTATANTGYIFTYWTEGDLVVSTSPTYSFTVTSDRTLVANFTETSTNMLILSNESSVPGSTVTMSVDLINSEDISGFQFDIVMNEHISYVEGSAALTDRATPQHIMIAQLINDGTILRIMCYSMPGTNFIGNSGPVVTFDLVITGEEGVTYTVDLDNPLISTIQGNTPEVIAIDGSVTIVSGEFHTITATANPTEGGTIAGAGVYYEGTIATLVATTLADFYFMNWTENGEVVSTENPYSFTVTNNRDLVANFEVNTLNPEEDLVAYYPFDGDVNDYSGNGNHGTIIGNVVPAMDRHGNPNGAYRFPGEPFNYISVPDAECLHLNSFTLSAWVYLDDEDFVNHGHELVNKGRDIRNGSYKLTLRGIGAQNEYGGVNGAYVDDFPSIGQWHMVTGTVDGDQARYYLDGVLMVEATLSHPFSYNNSEPLTLGCHYYNGVPSSWAYTLLGVLDEVRIYSRAFTPEEVQMLYGIKIIEITATANPEEGGTVSGVGTYYYGTECTLTATANEGYTFMYWTENGNLVSTYETYSFVVTGNRNLIANFTDPSTNILSIGDYTGTEGDILTIDINLANVDAVSGFQFDIPINEGFTYVAGSLVKGVRCSPYHIIIGQLVDNGSAFRVLCYSMPGANISGNDGAVASIQIILGEAGTYELGIENCILTRINGDFLPVIGNGGTLTVTGGQTVTYTVTATVNPAEGGTVTGSGTYQEGQTCTLTVTANESYTFINWTENGEVVSTENSYSFTVTGNRDLVANFMEGEACALNFDLYDSWGDGWNDAALLVSFSDGSPSQSLTFSSDHEASFTIEVNSGTNVTLTWQSGSYDSECSFVVSYADNGVEIYSVSAPSEGFLFEFIMDCEGIPTPTFEITASATPEEGGTVEGMGEYEFGSTCTLTVTANEGYTFINWTENDEVVSTENPYSFTVTGDRILVANFMEESPYIPTDGLIAYYPFNGNANDESGNGNHGTLQGNVPQLTTDRFGNENSAYLFGGYYNQGWVFVPNSSSLQLDSAMSMSFWINLSSYDGMDGWGSFSNNAALAIICKEGDRNGFNTCLNKHTDGRLNVHSWNNNGSYDINTYQDYTLGEWLHCVVTIENNLSKIYINGELQQDTINNQVNFSNANNCNMYIGIMHAGGMWYPFNGKIDDVILYNRALTPEEVQMLYGINIIEITATANPEEGGTIEGAGIHFANDTCTLTATPNLSYTFINWTENGEVVSTENPYTFTVTSDRELVANFMYVLPSLSDDFNDGVINLDYWTATGPNIYEEEGMIKIQQNQTDVYVALESQPMSLLSNNHIVMERRFLVHEQLHNAYWGSHYYYGGFQIRFNGSDSDYIGIAYLDDDYQNRHGTYLSLVLDGVATDTRICDASFDTWLEERIVVDFTNETLSYYLDNTLVSTLSIQGVANQQIAYFTAWFNSFGWWTGHYHNMDYVNINPLSEGLIAYYPFDGDANDYSGNEYHATPYNNYQYEDGLVGESIAVEGQGYTGSSGGHVMLPQYDFDASSGITLSLWVNALGLTSSDGEAYINLGDHTNADGLYILQNTNTVYFQYHNSYVAVPYLEDYTGNWVMYTMTCGSDGKLKAYINGAFVGEEDVEYNGQINTSLAALGRHWWYNNGATSTRFTGSFDEVRIYGRALTPEEVQMLYGNNVIEITATANPEEGGTVSGAGLFSHGDTCTLTATPKASYTFINWTENGEVISTDTTYIFMVTGNRELVANFTLPFTIMASVVPEEGGTVTGAGEYDYGTECTLTATATEDYYFVKWTKDGNVVSIQANYSFVVTEDGDYVAHFTPRPVGIVTAMYDPDPEDNQSPYVRVNWNMDTSMREDFESGDFSQHDWENNGWGITSNNPYEGNFCMNSNNHGHNSSSYAQVTVFIADDRQMSFWSRISSEGGWDYGRFYIDGQEMGSWSGNGSWEQHSYDINAGQHTFKWTYSKDGSVSSYDDCFYVDNINFVSAARGDRNVNHYMVYRDTYPTSGSPELIAEYVTDTTFVDADWSGLDEGWYQYGVKVSYSDSDTSSLYLSRMGWSNRILRAYPHTITATANPEEGGTIIGTGDYVLGTECTLTAVPNENYTFVNWTENGQEVSTEATYSFTVTGESELVANFSLPLTITASAVPEEGGTVTGAGEYDYGTECTLTATANDGYTFINWTENGEVVSTETEYSFVVINDRYLVANFVEGEPCAITFDLYDSYGDGWNGNRLVVNTDYGVTYEITLNGGSSGTQTLMLVDGHHITLTWINGSWIYECSFTMSYSNGNVIYTGGNLSGTSFEFDMDCEGMPATTFDITATANPEESGTITGAGEYVMGTECIVTAVANEGWTFVNWTENGSEVSTEASYTFTVTGDRNLVANFLHPFTISVSAVPEEGGTVTGAGEYDYGTECTLTATANEGYAFMYWTKDGIVVSSDATYSFIVTDDHNFVAYFAENSQTLSLGTGWNWISTYIEQEGIDGLTMLEEGLNPNGVMIKSQTDGFLFYANDMWIGNLDAITNEKMYLVNTSEASEVTLTGPVAHLNAHPITLNPNWTWVGYPLHLATDINVALANLNPAEGDMMKSQSGFATYMSGIGWFGSLNTLNPGMGLMYQSHNSQPITLTYSAGMSRSLRANVTAENNHWVPYTHAYPNNMSIMAVVELNGVELQDERYELAVFSGNECRGSVPLMYVEPMHRYVAFLSVAGEEDAELCLALYDTMTDEAYFNTTDCLNFESNAVVGSLHSPFVARFGGTEELDEFGAETVILYPNPVSAGHLFQIELPAESKDARVSIINAFGSVVSTTDLYAKPTTLRAPDVPGIYMVRVMTGKQGTYYRKLIVK